MAQLQSTNTPQFSRPWRRGVLLTVFALLVGGTGCMTMNAIDNARSRAERARAEEREKAKEAQARKEREEAQAKKAASPNSN